MLEKVIEKKVVDYATLKGMLSYKFTSTSVKGVPDRIFLFNGVTFFIEFKQLNKKPTKLQEYQIKKIESQNIKVYIIDGIEKGKRLIDEITR